MIAARMEVGRVIDGVGVLARPLTQRVADDEWLRAWRGIADACDDALEVMHPLHPRRGEMHRLREDAHLAAGRPVPPAK